MFVCLISAVGLFSSVKLQGKNDSGRCPLTSHIVIMRPVLWAPDNAL